MKAVVLCAGFGTRLAPLTDRIPKPLVPVANRPVLDHVLERLLDAGFDEVGINLHHKAEQILAHIQKRRTSQSIFPIVEPEILETGGGIANFREWARNEDFVLVHNSDVVTDINITELVNDHQSTGADVTFALVDDARFNVVGIDAAGRITDIRGKGQGSQMPAKARLTMSCVYLLSYEFMKRLEPGRKASVIEYVIDRMNEKPGSVRGLMPRRDVYWRDLGDLRSYLDLNREVLSGRAPHLSGLTVPVTGVLIASDASIADGARLEAPLAVGSRCSIGRNVHLTDCVVLDGTRLGDGFEADRSIILDDLVLAA